MRGLFFCLWKLSMAAWVVRGCSSKFWSDMFVSELLYSHLTVVSYLVLLDWLNVFNALQWDYKNCKNIMWPWYLHKFYNFPKVHRILMCFFLILGKVIKVWYLGSTPLSWIYTPSSNSGKWRFIAGFTTKPVMSSWWWLLGREPSWNVSFPCPYLPYIVYLPKFTISNQPNVVRYSILG